MTQTAAPTWITDLAAGVPDVDGHPFVDILADHYHALIAYEASYGAFVPTGLLRDATGAVRALGLDQVFLGYVSGDPEIVNNDGTFRLVIETSNGNPEWRDHDGEPSTYLANCVCPDCLDVRFAHLPTWRGEQGDEDGDMDYPSLVFDLPASCAEGYHGLSINDVLLLESLDDERRRAQNSGASWTFLPINKERDAEAERLREELRMISNRDIDFMITRLTRELEGVAAPDVQPRPLPAVASSTRRRSSTYVPSLPSLNAFIASSQQRLIDLRREACELENALGCSCGHLTGVAHDLISQALTERNRDIEQRQASLERSRAQRDIQAWNTAEELNRARAEQERIRARRREMVDRCNDASDPAWLTWPGTQEQFETFITSRREDHDV